MLGGMNGWLECGRGDGGDGGDGEARGDGVGGAPVNFSVQGSYESRSGTTDAVSPKSLNSRPSDITGWPSTPS